MSTDAERHAEAGDLKDFLGEKPYCDLVMKGGITSGVVYPRAIVELARQFRLKSIGGTSAGAIAAGAAAAAEFGRTTGGHRRLLGCADEISGLLLSLFQPSARLRPLFQALLATLGNSSWIIKLARVFVVLAVGYWPATLCGCLPAIGLAIYVGRSANHPIAWLAVVLTALAGVACALPWRLHRALTRDLPANQFGICSGLRQGRHPALTEWLADELDRIAGIESLESGMPRRPLTFGDLRGDADGEPQIDLQVMTTNLTEGRPYRIPFDEKNTFLFRPDEFRELFPPRIVEWMVEHSNPYEHATGYRWLPRTPDLPVIVGVRMSLSFPLLLSAVPLHARDFSLQTEADRRQPRIQWFSDGGLSSNFPIHFFDNIWPSWPTFGIKLVEYREDVHGTQRVALPQKALSGQLLEFRNIRSTGQFLSGVLGTMQEWRDNLQSILPGYRERIIQVRLAEDEGGMNLNMPRSRVTKLSAYGESAGREVCARFDWDAHRWRRFLVAVARLESLLADVAEVYETAPPQGEAMQAFLDRYSSQPAEYAQTQRWTADALADIADLLNCHQAWSARTPLGGGKIPKPEVEIRFTPRV
jgi:predicted acylesterase/phospholipase RssA